ncbi:MAG: hypothetical protein WCO26_20370, partial [Deltaproteobacteria bacterium]
LKRFRSKAFSSVPAGSVCRFFCNVEVISLAIATIEHLQHTRSLEKQHVEAPRSLAAWVAGLISALGLLAMVAVIFRL